jgi:hypothetical protein
MGLEAVSTPHLDRPRVGAVDPGVEIVRQVGHHGVHQRFVIVLLPPVDADEPASVRSADGIGGGHRGSSADQVPGGRPARSNDDRFARQLHASRTWSPWCRCRPTPRSPARPAGPADPPPAGTAQVRCHAPSRPSAPQRRHGDLLVHPATTRVGLRYSTSSPKLMCSCRSRSGPGRARSAGAPGACGPGYEGPVIRTTSSLCSSPPTRVRQPAGTANWFRRLLLGEVVDAGASVPEVQGRDRVGGGVGLLVVGPTSTAQGTDQGAR